MCEIICFAELIGGCLGGILLTLGVLALLVFRWPKREAKKSSAQSLETNIHFQGLG